MAVAILLGVVWLLRRRQWALLAFFAIARASCGSVLTPRATTWTAAKLLVLLSPMPVLRRSSARSGASACAGSTACCWRRRSPLGVLGSDAYLYHFTTLAPHGPLRRAAPDRRALRRDRARR